MVIDKDVIFSVVPLTGADTLKDEATKNTYWIQAWRWGTWDHALYGEVVVNPELAQEIVQHFRDNTFGQDTPVDYEHGQDPSKGLQAAAWVRDMSVREDGLYYLVEFTEDALNEIRAGKWRYFSPAYKRTLVNDETQQESHNVPTGGGLTNRPYFKGMLPLNFSELPEEHKSEFNHEWYEEYISLLRDRKQFNEHREEDSVNEELFREFCKALGITLPDGDIDREFVMSEATRVMDIVKPLEVAKTEAEQTKNFREAFPEEYNRIKTLEAAQHKSDAREFAQAYEHIKVEKDGRKDVEIGFSALALEKIEGLHLTFSEGAATMDDVKDVLDTIAKNGIVDYSEIGSSRKGDDTYADVDLKDTQAVRQQFSRLVKEIMTEDELDFNSALSEAAKRQPEMFEAYQKPPVAS